MWIGPRRMLPERMDDPAETEAAWDTALRDLGRLNRWTFADRPLHAFLARFAGETSLSVLDIGAGGGDVLASVQGFFDARGIATDLTALDISPHAAPCARRRHPGLRARWITADVFDLAEAERFDLVLCTLVAHHLPDPDVVRLLRLLAQRAKKGWLILDIQRDALVWAGLWLGTRLLRLDSMVVHDSTASVARAFRRADWDRYLATSGVVAQVRTSFPYRWAVTG